MIRCICIDDSNKPDIIPQDRWIKSGEEYRITWVFHYPETKSAGFTLYEKPLGEEFLPFESFDAHRFGIAADDLGKFVELCHQSADMDKEDDDEFFDKIWLN